MLALGAGRRGSAGRGGARGAGRRGRSDRRGVGSSEVAPWDEGPPPAPYDDVDAPPPFDPDADPVFERLRALRKRLADERGVPAYIIFNDRVLRAMADHRPQTPAELLRISGVGPQKLERYGQAFLEAITAGEY
jgi:superfamily II DNA helicase RecQ